MRFLDSVPRRRVSRRKNEVELGSQTKFVGFFSAAIGSPIRPPGRGAPPAMGPGALADRRGRPASAVAARGLAEAPRPRAPELTRPARIPKTNRQAAKAPRRREGRFPWRPWRLGGSILVHG